MKIRTATFNDAELLYGIELEAFGCDEATSLESFKELLAKIPCPYIFRVIERGESLADFTQSAS